MSTQDPLSSKAALAGETSAESGLNQTTDSSTTVATVEEDTVSSPQTQSPRPKSPRSPRPKFTGFKRFKQLAKFKGNNKEFLIAHSSPLASPITEIPITPSSEKASLIVRSEDNPADGDGGTEEEEDPSFLAGKIRQLIGSLPAVNHPTSESDAPAEPAPAPPHKSPEHDAKGCPIPPPSAVHVNDKHLLQLLSDPVVMNGRKEEWPTVWSILTSLSPPSNDESLGKDTTGVDSDSEKGKGDTATPASSLSTSVMIYIPLEPEEYDQVELASSVLVSVPVVAHPSSSAVTTHAWKWWPFPGKKGQSSEPSTPSTPGTPATPPQAPKKVWIPSDTKMSILATWWGYRIFLPPPVMKVLDNQEIEAVKRAAMISTALAWFFSHLPISMFPPTMQPVILMLQKIVPYITYIGTFISWTWSQIKSYDIGYGVILNATWLLPVALLPSTWRANQFPGVPPPNQDSSPGTPAPPTTTPSAPSAPPPSTTPSVPPSHPGGSTPVPASSTTPLPSTQPVQTSSESSGPKAQVEAPSVPTIALVDLTNKPSETTGAGDDVGNAKPVGEEEKSVCLSRSPTPALASAPAPAPLSPSLTSPTKFVEALDENKGVIAGFAAAVAAVRSLTPVLPLKTAEEPEVEVGDNKDKATKAGGDAEVEVVAVKQPSEPEADEAPTSTTAIDTQTTDVPSTTAKSDGGIVNAPDNSAVKVQEASEAAEDDGDKSEEEREQEGRRERPSSPVAAAVWKYIIG